MIKLRFLALIFVSILLAACSGKPTKPVEPTTSESIESSVETASTAPRSGLTPQEIAEQDAIGEEQNMLRKTIVYFEFDSTAIRSEFNAQLRAHGAELGSNRNRKVRLEGHADERGSREYNIGLGERRAQEVRRVLLLSGASSSQIMTISYGEERPAALGHDERAWGQNRRVELIVR